MLSVERYSREFWLYGRCWWALLRRMCRGVICQTDEVNFIVPDYAYSAGAIFCMSGDSIHMDYFSVLGPIDPQIQNREGKLVAALGYLDKINKLLEKARTNTLSQAEFVILKDFDLAELRGYEQAKDLTIDLLGKWLVKFNFKNRHQEFVFFGRSRDWVPY